MGWIIAAIILTVWVTVAVVLALVIARTVRLRDQREQPRPLQDNIPGDPPGPGREG